MVALKSLRQFFRDGYFDASGACHATLCVMTWRRGYGCYNCQELAD
jgi:hypothetical protein